MNFRKCCFAIIGCVSLFKMSFATERLCTEHFELLPVYEQQSWADTSQFVDKHETVYLDDPFDEPKKPLHDELLVGFTLEEQESLWHSKKCDMRRRGFDAQAGLYDGNEILYPRSDPRGKEQDLALRNQESRYDSILSEELWEAEKRAMHADGFQLGWDKIYRKSGHPFAEFQQSDSVRWHEQDQTYRELKPFYSRYNKAELWEIKKQKMLAAGFDEGPNGMRYNELYKRSSGLWAEQDRRLREFEKEYDEQIEQAFRESLLAKYRARRLREQCTEDCELLDEKTYTELKSHVSKVDKDALFDGSMHCVGETSNIYEYSRDKPSNNDQKNNPSNAVDDFSHHQFQVTDVPKNPYNSYKDSANHEVSPMYSASQTSKILRDRERCKNSVARSATSCKNIGKAIGVGLAIYCKRSGLPFCEYVIPTTAVVSDAQCDFNSYRQDLFCDKTALCLWGGNSEDDCTWPWWSMTKLTEPGIIGNHWSFE